MFDVASARMGYVLARGFFVDDTQESYYNKQMAYKPVVLIVLDGVGVPPPGVAEHPFAAAAIPTFHEFEEYYPFTTLRASGIAVGLPWGEEGNSEVGHLTMGAGRVIYHHLPRIITAVHDGSFFQNEAFLTAAAHVQTGNATLHLMGLFSSGSVHAYVDHLYALLEFAKRQNVSRVMVHPFTDGRDASPNESAHLLQGLEERLQKEYPSICIASVMGRTFAMDRDGRWDRTECAYNLLVTGAGSPFTSAAAYVRKSYASGVTDEFIEPGYRVDAQGKAIGIIHDGDAVIYWDFREDSARQLTSAFVTDEFSHFTRKQLRNLCFVTMTEYDKQFPALIAFPPIGIAWPLTRVVAQAGKTQLHVAELDKYAHVTYFFNGGVENPFPKEERILIPSLPGDIREHPEMAADRITEAVLRGIGTSDFIVANYANGDMVGHTGDFTATVRALEVLDASLAKIKDAVLQQGGALVVTADHGNTEEKRYRYSGEPRTKHTTNPVPLYLITQDARRSAARSKEEIREEYKKTAGVLTDVAPTVLALMSLETPGEMTGVSLLDALQQAK